MRLRSLLLPMVLAAALAAAQDTAKPGTIAPQGSSIPGLSGVPGLEGGGYIEFGGGRSDLTKPLPSWTDFYARGLFLLTPSNAADGEIDRESRYGDQGWYYSVGITHTFSSDIYADAHVGASRGGFFLPKYRADGTVNFKLLPRKRLVFGAGAGYDRSKTLNTALRTQTSWTYYFDWPFMVQGGVVLTRANPGGILAPSGYAALTQGREKEHYITFRMETGREAYELLADPKRNRFSAFDFPIHNYAVTWRQWVGNNWGLNLNLQRDVNPFYNRNGATLGLFLDF